MAGRHAEAQAEQQRIYAADYLGMTWGTEALKAGLGMMGHASMSVGSSEHWFVSSVIIASTRTASRRKAGQPMRVASAEQDAPKQTVGSDTHAALSKMMAREHPIDRACIA